VVGDAEHAGSALLTLLVDDLAGWVLELEGRGLAAGEIDTIPGVVSRTAIADPDGNSITVGEPLG
jgi:glyoxylase I family protein